MEIQNYRSVYFLGIGGIGMSALARYFHRQGAAVSGYDKTPTPLTRQLIEDGIPVHYMENTDLVGQPDLVVYTPAIPKENIEFQFVLARGIPLKKRSEVLGMITRNTKTIAISGTHGKTTITTMIAHLFKTAGMPGISFLGGISKNYHSNFIVSPNPEISSPPEYYIAEADEFDHSFLQLYPDIAVITSADADHLDIYGTAEEVRNSFRQFASHLPVTGTLILKKGLEFLVDKNVKCSVKTYHATEDADFYPQLVRVENHQIAFDLVTPERTIKNILLGLPGKFNLENSIAAAAVAYTAGVPDAVISQSLLTFQGVERRFDFQVIRDDMVYIDDYAHHPEELKACIGAAREIYPTKRITGIFQPHLFTRTRDFADEFARSLEMLDELILLEIYPAREKPIPGVDSSMLLSRVHLKNKILCKKADLLTELKLRKPEVLLTLGAGDIDQLVGPIRELFMIKN